MTWCTEHKKSFTQMNDMAKKFHDKMAPVKTLLDTKQREDTPTKSLPDTKPPKDTPKSLQDTKPPEDTPTKSLPDTRQPEETGEPGDTEQSEDTTQSEDIRKPEDTRLPEDTKQPVKRSRFRVRFIKRLVNRADKIYDEFTRDPLWGDTCRHRDTMPNHALVQGHLILPAVTLTNTRNQWFKQTRETKSLLLFVFDEAANLWVDKKNGDPFFALRRALGMLKTTPIWSFLLSTQSGIGSLLPSKELEVSEQILSGRL